MGGERLNYLLISQRWVIAFGNGARVLSALLIPISDLFRRNKQMKQTHKMSVIESVTNVVFGFALGFGVNLILIRMFFPDVAGKEVETTLYALVLSTTLTIGSVVRIYLIRRWFEFMQVIMMDMRNCKTVDYYYYQIYNEDKERWLPKKYMFYAKAVRVRNDLHYRFGYQYEVYTKRVYRDLTIWEQIKKWFREM